MVPLSARKILGALVILAIIVAVGAGAMGLLMIAAVRNEQVFRVLLKAIAALYSRTGTISPAGVEMIKRTVTVLIWASGALAAGAVMFSVLLRRVVHDPEVLEAPESRSVEETRPEESLGRPGAYASVALGLLAVGAALRVSRLSSSLSYDEIFSIQNFATLPFFKIPFVQVEANNHVLNSLLLHLTLRFSSEEALLRLPMYLAGVGSLWLFFLLGRCLWGPLTGLFALWLAAVSPYHLWYSTLARGYMPGLFFALMGLYILLRAERPPSRRSLLTFGATQALAIWAVPIFAIVPLLLAGFVLLGALSPVRLTIGVDPRSQTGAAWLATALSVVAIMGLLHLPILPIFIFRLGRGGGQIGGSLVTASDWLGVFQQGGPGILTGAGVIGLGLGVFLKRRREETGWEGHFLAFLWAVSFILFLLQPSPARAHVIVFVAAVLLAAIGIRSLLVMLAFHLGPPEGRAWVGRTMCAACLVGITLASWGETVEAARGTPFEDIRRATQVVESALEHDGIIVTSGFGYREIGYYATHPVQLLSSTTDPSKLLTAVPTLCYFRLYAKTDRHDPVLDYFHAYTPSGVVSGREDSIPLWCFHRARVIPLRVS